MAKAWYLSHEPTDPRAKSLGRSQRPGEGLVFVTTYS